jgi:hypothetical protein
MNRLVPEIVFEPKDSAGHDLSGVKVTMDGTLLSPRIDGSALQVDPGDHVFVFDLAGQPSVTQHFLIHEGDRGRHEQIVFGPPATDKPPPAPPRPEAPPKETRSGSGWSTNKSLAFVAGGVGLLGVGIGSVFGLEAKSKGDQSKEDGHCDATGCDPVGKGLRNDAFSDATISTVAFTVGLVGLAGGLALWLTAPSSGKTVAISPALGNQSGTINVSGRW